MAWCSKSILGARRDVIDYYAWYDDVGGDFICMLQCIYAESRVKRVRLGEKLIRWESGENNETKIQFFQIFESGKAILFFSYTACKWIKTLRLALWKYYVHAYSLFSPRLPPVFPHMYMWYYCVSHNIVRECHWYDMRNGEYLFRSNLNYFAILVALEFPHRII